MQPVVFTCSKINQLRLCKLVSFSVKSTCNEKYFSVYFYEILSEICKTIFRETSTQINPKIWKTLPAFILIFFSMGTAFRRNAKYKEFCKFYQIFLEVVDSFEYSMYYYVSYTVVYFTALKAISLKNAVFFIVISPFMYSVDTDVTMP